VPDRIAQAFQTTSSVKVIDKGTSNESLVASAATDRLDALTAEKQGRVISKIPFPSLAAIAQRSSDHGMRWNALADRSFRGGTNHA